MDTFAAVNHLLQLLAPALFIALLLALPALARRTGDADAGPGAMARCWHAFWRLALVGSVALTAGLAAFGEDGRIASYAALVLASGTARWLLARGWRG